MNLSEAMQVYLSDETYENLVLGTTKLICDRGTKRIYLINGTSAELTIDQIASDDWTVVRNQ